jgi:catechol 2,3-dioxygenase
MSITLHPARLGHVALAAADPHRLGRFYMDVLGLRHVRDVHHEIGGEMVELTSGPHEDHELVLTEKPAGSHIAFRVDTLEALRGVHAACVAAGVLILLAHDAGHSIAFFARDPEGNVVELYWPTGRPRRPRPVPVDLSSVREAREG